MTKDIIKQTHNVNASLFPIKNLKYRTLYPII